MHKYSFSFGPGSVELTSTNAKFGFSEIYISSDIRFRSFYTMDEYVKNFGELRYLEDTILRTLKDIFETSENLANNILDDYKSKYNGYDKFKIELTNFEIFFNGEFIKKVYYPCDKYDLRIIDEAY